MKLEDMKECIACQTKPGRECWDKKCRNGESRWRKWAKVWLEVYRDQKQDRMFAKAPRFNSGPVTFPRLKLPKREVDPFPVKTVKWNAGYAVKEALPRDTVITTSPYPTTQKEEANDRVRESLAIHGGDAPQGPQRRDLIRLEPAPTKVGMAAEETKTEGKEETEV